MSAGGFFGSGKVINNSDGTVLCYVQDDGAPEVYQLGPGMESISHVDVDMVKAVTPGTLNPYPLGMGSGVALWFKFNDAQTATISGAFPNLLVDISPSLLPTCMATQYTDDQAIAAGGQSGSMDQFMKSQGGWGMPIPVVDPSIYGGYPLDVFGGSS